MACCDEDLNGYPEFGDSDEEEIDTCSPSLCLFCEAIFTTCELALSHISKIHGVPLLQLLQTRSCDFYSYIKIINYFRRHKPPAHDYQTVESVQGLTTLDQSYMIPECEDDGLLQFDVEGYQESHLQLGLASKDNSPVTLSANEYEALKSKALQLDQLKRELEDLKSQYTQDLTRLRSSAQRLISSGPLSSMTEYGDVSTPPTVGVNTSKVHSLNDAQDDGYIGSYSHYSIHMDMLQDKVRTDGYRQAIVENSEMFRDKIVLDVGCGTSVLSMFAAKAGAKHVYAVDMSDIIYQAMDIVRENQLEDRITLIKGRIEEVKLPVDHVDIIISEWMGYFLLFESMLDSVIFARNKWLSVGGLVWPNRCKILMTASCDPGLRQKNIDFWEDVYGFKMTCMKYEVCKEGLVQTVNSSHIVCPPVEIQLVDCCTSNITQLDFTSDFTLLVNTDCTIHALIGYFDTFFDHEKASHQVTFSTGPLATPTHWKQTVFLLAQPLHKKQGESISGVIEVKKVPKDPRSLQIKIKIESVTYKYILS